MREPWADKLGVTESRRVRVDGCKDCRESDENDGDGERCEALTSSMTLLSCLSDMRFHLTARVEEVTSGERIRRLPNDGPSAPAWTPLVSALVSSTDATELGSAR